MIDFSKQSDAELESIVRQYTPGSHDAKHALAEIYRRKQIKEQESKKYNRKIELYTIIILVFTFLTLVIGIVQLFK
jgi:hypothetical protein